MHTVRHAHVQRETAAGDIALCADDDFLLTVDLFGVAVMHMRILMVIGQFRPTVGGAERQCELLARALIARGHDVRVFTVRPERSVPLQDIVAGVPVERVAYPIVHVGKRRLGGGVLAPLLLGWGVWRRARSADVILAHQALWPAFVACVVARIRRRPIIVKLGNSGERFDLEVLRRTHWYGAYAARVLQQRVTAFIATSAAVRDDLLASGVHARRIVEIPNGVDVPATAQPRASDDRIRYIAVGTLTPKKNFRVLLDAIGQLDGETRARCSWTIVGDGPLRGDLVDHAAALGIGSVVTFVGEVSDVPALLMTHDVFVLPSRTEGLSNAALEAMANGLPLLLSDAGGNRDLVPDVQRMDGAPFAVGTTGILVDPTSPNAIAAAFHWFLTHAVERTQMGAAARIQAVEQYAMERIATRYEELLRGATTPLSRAVHLLTFLDEQTGGMERQALQLARELRRHGHACFFITCAHVDRMRHASLPFIGTMEGFRIYRIPFLRGWRRWNALWYGLVSSALLLMFQRRYDLIHAHQLQTSGLVASVVRRLLPSKRLLVKDATGGTFGDVTELRRLLGGRGIATLRQHVDRFVAVSQEVLEELASIGCTSVVQIPNSVDCTKFQPPDAVARAQARAAVLGGGALAQTMVLTVGRLHVQKNIPTLIDAVAMLDPSYVLVVVGGGSERHALERYVHQKSMRSRVIFVGAVADVTPYYRAADVFVIPSRSEGLPNVVLEAMACGLPVTGSNIPSIRSILPTVLQTTLVAPDDAAGLAASIRHIVDSGVHARAAEGIRRHVTERYSLDTIVARYRATYQDLMEGVLA